MRKQIFDMISSVMNKSKNLGIAQITADKKGFNNNSFSVNGKEYINFSLCDYLALGHDDRLKNGAIDSLNQNGFYASVSRAYIKLNIYEEAEDYLVKVFGRPVLLFPRTTLAHLGVLPVITDINDAIILDQQVHTSVKMGADLLKSYGNHVESIHHSNIDQLEDKIKSLKNKYSKIWYLADGVYSTHGDLVPIYEIARLLNKYEQFHLYIDDSHGMSWAGNNGKGYIHQKMGYHPHMVLSTSLCKGFGAEGGVIVCYDDEIKNRLVTCAAPLTFTSPISPSTLGAIIASCKIHITDEIYDRQNRLIELIKLFNYTAKGLELPLIGDKETPIGFFAVGQTNICMEVCTNLMNKGYFVNAIFFSGCISKSCWR